MSLVIVKGETMHVALYVSLSFYLGDENFVLIDMDRGFLTLIIDYIMNLSDRKRS